MHWEKDWNNVYLGVWYHRAWDFHMCFECDLQFGFISGTFTLLGFTITGFIDRKDGGSA